MYSAPRHPIVKKMYKSKPLPLFQSLKLLLASLLSLSFSGCGYQAARTDEKLSISVPYVQGDNQGQLTAAIIREIDQSGLYDFVRQDGDLLLKITLVGDGSSPIGFRYDRKEKSGKIEHNIMATENRRTVVAQVVLTRGATEEVVLGPLNISSCTDYDYIPVDSLKELSFINPQGKREKVMTFSLGQLDSIEGAQDAAVTPIYEQLAQRIVAALAKHTMLSSDD
jgi:hypothetical protein